MSVRRSPVNKCFSQSPPEAGIFPPLRDPCPIPKIIRDALFLLENWGTRLIRHVISALVQNRPGVLAQVSGMLAARAFNIDSLAVGETEDPNLSRMTFVVHGDDAVLDQARKQLDTL